MMEYRTLGRTGLEVSLVGLGTGGPSRIGQATGRSEAESRRLVRTALDLGINIFDSAPRYDESERLLGQALEGVPRDDYVLATKFHSWRDEGIRTVKEDPSALMESLEASLRNLQVDTIDVYQFHALSSVTYDEAMERYYPQMLKAREQGKIRFIGMTEEYGGDRHHEGLVRAARDGYFDTFMVKYGILQQTAEDALWDLVLQHNIGVMVMAAVRTTLRDPHEAQEQIQAFIDEAKLEIEPTTVEDPLGLGRTGDPAPDLTRAGYQFAARPDAVSTVLVGTGNPDHLREDVKHLLSPFCLTAEQYDYLRETYGHLTWPN
jgi:aryl-alcohol dehydrogenase-like predicted oxidoreductase